MKKDFNKLKGTIERTIANYWLKENPYCGLSTSMIKDRISEKNLTIERLNKIAEILKKNLKISTRKINKDLWVYPKEKLLRKFDRSSYESVGKYVKQLRKGGSQIELRFFKRQVLDRYRDDPCYNLRDDGFSGHLSIRDELYLDPKFSQQDKISIQSFGPAYLKDGTRIITVILKDLGRLSIKHQNYWDSFEIEDRCLVDKDFYDQNFKGEWVDRISPFTAILQELKEINKLCELIGEPNLFLKTWDELPVSFSWMTKSTEREFENLANILNKLIIENLNKKFFKGKIPLKDPVTKDHKGTISLLNEYLKKFFNPLDQKPIDEMIVTFSKIRKIRKSPAHKVKEDKFDSVIQKKETDLIFKTYGGLNILRQIFMLHPLAKKYSPPKWLEEAKIA